MRAGEIDGSRKGNELRLHGHKERHIFCAWQKKKRGMGKKRKEMNDSLFPVS